MAEYECFPIWREEPDGVVNVAPEDIGLPEALASELNTWALRYEETFDASDPGKSGFADPADESEFYSRGLELARKLAEALAQDAEVYFFDGRTGQLLLV